MESIGSIKNEFLADVSKVLKGELPRPSFVNPQNKEASKILRLILAWLERNRLWMTQSVLFVETATPNLSRFVPDMDAEAEASQFDQVKDALALDALRAMESNGIFRETKAKILASRYLEHMEHIRYTNARSQSLQDAQEEQRLSLLVGFITSWLNRQALNATEPVLIGEFELVYGVAPLAATQTLNALFARFQVDYRAEPETLEDLTAVANE